MTDQETIEIILTLVPHRDDTPAARRVPNPALAELMEPDWWSRALFGPRGAADPIPRVVGVRLTKANRYRLLKDGAPEPVE